MVSALANTDRSRNSKALSARGYQIVSGAVSGEASNHCVRCGAGTRFFFFSSLNQLKFARRVLLCLLARNGKLKRVNIFHAVLELFEDGEDEWVVTS